MKDEKKGLTRISSLIRALRVLDFIGSNPDGYEVKEIAFSNDINISTCYHILNTLQDEGYILKKTEGTYVLGAKIPKLNRTFLQSIKPEKILIDTLYELQEQTGESAYYVGVREKTIMIQSIVESANALRVNTLHEGYSGNHHARSSSKAILAYWEEEEIRNFFKDYKFEVFTEKTPDNIDELLKQLKRIRTQGYCLDEEEFSSGVCCIAVPIMGLNQKPVGSYAISCPKERYFANKSKFIELTVEAANKVSAFIQYI